MRAFAGRMLRARLHTKLMLALAVLVAAVVTGSAYVLIERERARRLLELEERAAQFADLLSRSLAQPLWNVDLHAINGQLAALSNYSEVVELTVTEAKYGPVSTMKGPQAANPTGRIVRVRPIEYAALEGLPIERIGTIQVILSRAAADEAIAGFGRAILLIAAAIIASLYGATFVLLQRMVGEPVSRLETMVDRIAGGDLDVRCAVESGDELGRLATRVNMMAGRLRESTAQLRESERKYRNIFEAVGVSIWEEDFSQVKAAIDQLKAQGVRDFRQYLNKNPDFVQEAVSMVKIVDVNSAALRLFAAQNKDELLVSLHRIFTPETTDMFEKELEFLVTLGETSALFEAETPLQTLKGEPLTALFTITFPPQSDRFDRVLVTVTDITERKRAEEQQREAQAQLAHVTRVATLGEFAGSIAHEVKQPLTAIINNADACLALLPGEISQLEDVREALSDIISDADRASAVIERIRGLIKKSPPQKSPLDLGETIGGVIALARGELDRNGVLLQTKLTNDLPPIIGDRIQLQQVILNLIINAIEAMSGVNDGPRELLIISEKAIGMPGEPEQGRPPDAAGLEAELRAPNTDLSDVALAKSERRTRNAYVLVSVADSGPGLDRNSVDRLFNAFYTTKPHGLGMGLSISRSIIEAHGGQLWAKANVPKGALFQFTLPAVAGSDEQ